MPVAPTHSSKLDLARSKHTHTQQQQSVTETADLRGAVFAVFVPDDDFGNLKIQFGGAEQQIEIAEGIEIAEIISVFLDGLIVGPIKRLGAA